MFGMVLNTRLKPEQIFTSSCENCKLKITLSGKAFKLYNSKYMMASTQITNTEVFPIIVVIVVIVFKLLSRKVLFINRKNNKNC